MIRCSYLYYKEGHNIKEVAERLNISRFKVSRYLNEAQEKGIVEIRFNIPDLGVQSLSLEIEKLFPVNRAVVVPVSTHLSEDDVRRSVGHKGAEILAELEADLSIGITWGRTIAYMVDDLPDNGAAFKQVSELTGGFGLISEQLTTSSLAPLLAKKTGALCYQMHGPILSSTPTIARNLLSDNSIIRTIEMAKQSDLAIYGVASLNENALIHRSGFVKSAELMGLRELGAVGTIMGRFFDGDGNELDSEFKTRSIAVSWEDFRNIPERIALVAGLEKALPTRSLLEGGLVSTLIIDSVTATALVEETKKRKEEKEDEPQRA